MGRSLFCLAMIALIAGCASTQMKRYIGQDITQVMLDYGQPESVLDLGDGKRGYQYRWGGGTFTTPTTATTRGSVTSTGNTASYNETTQVTGGQTIQSGGCLLTYIAEQNEDERWIITDYNVPPQLVC